MNILLLHNHYLQPGGEDAVFAGEAMLLEQHGHTVVPFRVHNEEVAQLPAANLLVKTLWNTSTHSKIRSLIREHRIDVCHCHNTFPLLSPAVYYAAHAEGIPVVQTLHNYRLLCPKAVFYREGRVCEDCLHSTVPWRSVLHSCYRGSRAATAATALMLTTHRLAGTYQKQVDVYVALTEFCRNKFIEGGLPADRIVVKPNFLFDDPGPGIGAGGYALFVGRLTEEKGIRTVLRAWSSVPRSIELKIAGDGPLAPEVAAAAAAASNIDYLGPVPGDRVRALMRDAAALVFPSEWFEAGPMSLIEAFACGTPAIASRLGSAESVVKHGVTGFHFEPGDADSLAAIVQTQWASPETLRGMRHAARLEFEREYTAEHNYDRLMSVYSLAGAASSAKEGFVRRAAEC